MSALNIVGAVGELAGRTLVEVGAFTAVNNYLSKNTGAPLPHSPTIPTSKRSPKLTKKMEQTEKLQGLSDGLAGSIGAAILGAGAVAHNMATSSAQLSGLKNAEKEALKSSFPASPLIQNQIAIAQSSDAIVDAINANSIVSATVFGTLDANLSAISSALLAISSTLIEISDNYASEIEKSEDLPYIDSETFYDLLVKQGMPQIQAWQLKTQEAEMVDSLSKGGHTYPEIKQAITAYRKSVVPPEYMLKMEGSASGLTTPKSVDSTTGQPIKDSSFPDLSALTEWATSAKIVSDFMGTSKIINDLDGVPVAETSPMEAQAIKNASDARHKTDINNETFDDEDNPLAGLDLMPFINFVGRADTFDTTKALSNDFMPAGV